MLDSNMLKDIMYPLSKVFNLNFLGLFFTIIVILYILKIIIQVRKDINTVKTHEESIKFLLKENEHYHNALEKEKDIIDKMKNITENSNSSIDFNSLTEGKISNSIQDTDLQQIKNTTKKRNLRRSGSRVIPENQKRNNSLNFENTNEK